MTFGWHGIKISSYDPESIPKTARYQGRQEKVTFKDKHAGALNAARKEAKRRGLSLKQYLSIPRQDRPV